MFELYKFSEPEILAFILVLVRMSVFVSTMPLIGAEQVPIQTKILLSLALTIVIFPTVGWQQIATANFGNQLIWLALKEALVGVTLGFVARLFFFALSIAGEVISLGIGLSSEQLLNPAVGGRATAIQQFQIFLGTLLFFSLNGHFQLLSGIVTSYEVVPLTLDKVSYLQPQMVASLGQEIIWAGIKIAAPVMGAVFFMNLVMGVMGRAVPQINVLITSLPVNVLVGLGILFLAAPFMVGAMDGLSEVTAARLFQVMKGL